MPALANLVINDRMPTPVAHTLVPYGTNGEGVGTLVEVTGIPVGEPKFTLSCIRKNGKVRGKLVLAVPIVQTETINGVARPVVVRTGYIEVNTTFDGLSLEQERANVVGLMANAMAASQTLVNDVLVKALGVS